MPIPVVVIATVLNEGESARSWLDSLIAQTRPPDQVVLVDGGSRDDTAAILHQYADRLPLTVLVVPGANISTGRNHAIAAIKDSYDDPIIAVTDAGVILEATWLECLTQPLQTQPGQDASSAEGCAGFFLPDPHSIFEAALGATTLPLRDEIDPRTFLPSSRSVAFRKSAWVRVGGYPEWIDYCEDLIFDLRLKAVLPPFAFAPDAVVRFRPRPTLSAFYRQYYRYARGDGKADLWRKRHDVRYGTYLVALPVLLGLGIAVHPVFLALLLAGGFVYVRTPYRRLPTVLAAAEANDVRVTVLTRLYAVVLVPVIRIVGDVAKMVGYPVGWWWRLKHHPPQWKHDSMP